LISGSRKYLRDAQLEKYLQEGYTVISIDYRLAPETKIPLIIDDLKDAYRWILQNGPERFHIDTDRIAVIGQSAGGYLTLMSGFVLEPRPKALVSFYGYGDIIGDWYSKPDSYYLNTIPAITKEQAYQAVGQTALTEGSNDRFRFYFYLRQQGLWPIAVSGHDPSKEPDWFTPYMPIRNVDPHYPPTLLLHGESDTDVPFEMSVMIADELKKHGVEHQFISHPKWGHGFDGKMDDPEIAQAFEQVLTFLRKHLKP